MTLREILAKIYYEDNPEKLKEFKEKQRLKEKLKEEDKFFKKMNGNTPRRREWVNGNVSQLINEWRNYSGSLLQYTAPPQTIHISMN